MIPLSEENVITDHNNPHSMRRSGGRGKHRSLLLFSDAAKSEMPGAVEVKVDEFIAVSKTCHN